LQLSGKARREALDKRLPLAGGFLSGEYGEVFVDAPGIV
jgi:hypothetical protein